MRLRIVILLLLAAPMALQALGVKVEWVDRAGERIRVLLPTHSVRMEAEALPGALSDEKVQPGGFYDASLRHEGKVRNILRIKLPGKKDVKYRILTVTFLD